MNRIVWIDLLRGFCMMLILWFHTEVYYAGQSIIPYDLYVVNALTTFYFISGYLLYSHQPFSLRSKLLSILRGLVVPYFFFTLLLALPKALMTHQPVIDIIIHILQGNGSWFVSSLITAEVIFACVLYVHNRWLIHLLPLAALAGAWLLTGSEVSMHHNYWNFHNALIGLVFMYLGYEYHRHKQRFQPFHRLSSLLLLFLLLIIIKVYVIRHDISLLIEPVLVSNYPLFMADSICFILLALGIFSRLPRVKWMEWIGRHSLVYYFFCGGVPMVVARLMPAYHHYYTMPIAFLMVCMLSTAIVWLCYRYLTIILKH